MITGWAKNNFRQMKTYIKLFCNNSINKQCERYTETSYSPHVTSQPLGEFLQKSAMNFLILRKSTLYTRGSTSCSILTLSSIIWGILFLSCLSVCLFAYLVYLTQTDRSKTTCAQSFHLWHLKRGCKK